MLHISGALSESLGLTLEQMLDLKENIENEVHSAYDEYLKMESHIKLYVTEMEQAISS